MDQPRNGPRAQSPKASLAVQSHRLQSALRTCGATTPYRDPNAVGCNASRAVRATTWMACAPAMTSPLWRWSRRDLEQRFRLHRGVEASGGIERLVPLDDLRQPGIGDGIAEALAGFAIAYDHDGKHSWGRLLRHDHQRSLTRTRVGRKHHPIGDAGTGCLLAGVIRHGEPARLRLDALL